MGQEARAGQIRRMFDEIAPHYDARNRLFSVDRDRAWRRRAARRAGLRPGQTALDLCTGTGKLAHELLPYVGPGGRVIGVDFSASMLELARTLEPQVEFRQGDVGRLSEADASVHAVTIGFGLRNLTDREGSLREMHRVLRPGGRLVVLELAPPTGSLLRGYRFYLDRVMPMVAGLFSPVDGQAYRYLAETVAGFPPPAMLAAMLERIGFKPVTVERMTFGIVALHIACRPG